MKRLSFLFIALALLLDIQAQSRWMSALDDAIAVSSLSIPGAHDAATSSIHGMGRCQILTIEGQLQVGVRAFDLRPTQKRRFTFNGFSAGGLGNIYHGLKSTGVSLDEAFGYFNTFLEKNPKEFIIVIIRDESDGRYLFGKPESSTFTAYMREFLQKQTRVLNFRDGLKVGDCRGGIIVLCRTGSPSDMASTYVSWSHGIDGGRDRRIYYTSRNWVRLAVQDCYSPSVVSRNCGDEEFMKRKVAAVKNFIDYAASEKGVWVINHASAYVGGYNYCRNAEWVNTRVARYIIERKDSVSTGIVMMDFAGVSEAKYRGKTYNVCGDSLLRAVIENNFKK